MILKDRFAEIENFRSTYDPNALVTSISRKEYLDCICICFDHFPYDNFASLSTNKSKKIPYLANKMCRFVNMRGPNSDYRCTRDDKVEYERQNPNEIFYEDQLYEGEFEYQFGDQPTDYELSQCIWKIKTSRIDSWYELYNNIESVTEENNEITILVNFSHGS